MVGVQLLKPPPPHLLLCIQPVTLSQGRPENCPQPLFLEVSGPGPPLLPGQQVCLIHQQHVHLMLRHLLYVRLLAAHNRKIIQNKIQAKCLVRLYTIFLLVIGSSNYFMYVIWIILII